MLWIIAAVLLALAGLGLSTRMAENHKVAKATAAQAIRVVRTTKLAANTTSEDLTLPGELRAYNEAPIYARTNGYLKRWLVDIGDKVKMGDLLAEIESPEVDQQLHQAEADVAQAKTNLELADITAKRYRELLKTTYVSQQTADEKISDAHAKQAALLAAEANLSRIKQLQDFEKVMAPFDGTITERSTDVGTLINAGNGNGQPLFHIAAVDKLRLYVQTPEPYAQKMTPGLQATLNVTEHPGEVYTAKLVSTSGSIDKISRSLLVQLEVDNSKGELLAGSYVETHFKIPPTKDSVVVPVNTLLFRAEGIRVATVASASDGSFHVAMKPVTIGRDYGNTVEISAGLKPEDSIILNVPDSISDGETVQIAESKIPEASDVKK